MHSVKRILTTENRTCAIRPTAIQSPNRVGFLPEETYFFQDTWKKLEESGLFRKKVEEIGIK